MSRALVLSYRIFTVFEVLNKGQTDKIKDDAYSDRNGKISWSGSQVNCML